MTTDRARRFRPGIYKLECECCQTQWNVRLRPDIDPDAFIMAEGADYCPKCVNRQFKIASGPAHLWRDGK